MLRADEDVATLGRRKLTARRSASVAATPRVATSGVPSARGDLSHARASRAYSEAGQSEAERRGAARRDACCASSRAEDETTRKKLRRMHATVVRASLNSRVLVSGAYSGAKMLEFHERTLNSSSLTGGILSRARRVYV